MKKSRPVVRWWTVAAVLGVSAALAATALTGNAASADPGFRRIAAIGPGAAVTAPDPDCSDAEASPTTTDTPTSPVTDAPTPPVTDTPADQDTDQGTGTGTGSTLPATGEPAVTMLAGLQQRLGDRAAGTWVDKAGQPVVAVTDATSASEVRRAGAVARCVEHSRSQLHAGMSALDVNAAVPGTSWAVDPATNQILVTYDSTVTAEGMQQLRTTVAGLGDMVRTQAVEGRLSTTLSGGDAIFGQNARCSLGFVVSAGNAPGFLTAGHCGNEIRNWTVNGRTLLGRTVSSSFPENDFALVQVVDQNEQLTGTVGRRDITTAGTPVVGQQVTRRGSTTGTHRGQVTALNATVNFPEGRVSGLIQTTVCAEPGDSGGPLFSGRTALGLTSGGSGDCTRGGVTFFQPVTEALQALGATLE